MKTRVFNLIILDESGSMQSIAKEAVDGVNETLQTVCAAQKKHEEQVHYVSLVTFNDDVKTIYDCVAADEAKELTSESYSPNCCTALYDAMGIALNALKTKVAQDDKVLVTVITDGEENSSKEYNGKSIKALVDKLKAKGWVFAYIGANHDVEKFAASISISNTLSFQATPSGTAAMGCVVNHCRMAMYDAISNEDDLDMQKFNENFFS